MIKNAGDVAPCRQSDTSPVLERLWLEKIYGEVVAKPIRQHLSPRMLSLSQRVETTQPTHTRHTWNEALIPKTHHSPERWSSLLSPSNYLHTTVANMMREKPSVQTACNKIGRLRQTGSAHRGLSLIRQARSETKPTTSPFDFMQFLAQQVQGYVAAQCRHSPILQEEGDFVAGSM